LHRDRDPRDRPGPRHRRPDGRRPAARLPRHFGDRGALAGLAACLLALQYDVHPFVGNTFGPLIFMICVLGGLGDMIGGFVAAFIIAQIIAIGGYYWSTELSYVLAFTLFIALMFVRPRGILAR